MPRMLDTYDDSSVEAFDVLAAVDCSVSLAVALSIVDGLSTGDVTTPETLSVSVIWFDSSDAGGRVGCDDVRMLSSWTSPPVLAAAALAASISARS